jgi:TBC1 domain family member 14
VLPAVHGRLVALGIRFDTFVSDWVLTLFAKSLPLDVAARIWDMFLLEGDVVIFRGIIGAFVHSSAVRYRLLARWI